MPRSPAIAAALTALLAAANAAAQPLASPLNSAPTSAAAALASLAKAPSATAAARMADGAEPMAECEVIARVNGEVVTACEVMWHVNLMLEDKLDRIPSEELPKIRNALMKRELMGLLDTKILYGDFRRKAEGADLDAIHQNLAKPFEEKELDRLVKIFGVDDKAELPQRMADLGTSMRDQREDFFQKMIARSWINESLKVDRDVDRDQLLAAYRAKAASYDYPTQARWEELMLRFDRFGGDKAAAYAAMAQLGNEAYGAFTAQADQTKPAFEAIAKAKSHAYNAGDGGQNDWTTKGSLADERIDEALFTLPVGQMSPILESDRGFHIVRVIERKEAGRTPFTEVQGDIRREIIRKRSDLAFNKKLSEMRRSARIWTVFDGDIDAVEYAAARESKSKRR